MQNNTLSRPGCSFSGTALKRLACLSMLVDHLGASLLENGLFRCSAIDPRLVGLDQLLRLAGRLAFPIYCFLLVEGFLHTHDFKKYALRMLGFAVLSEVPFNLMCGGTWFYPVHQNVIWTLLMGLLGVHLLETVRRKQKPALFAAAAVGVILAGAVLGILCMVDYYAVGVLTVLVFYFFRGRAWWCLAGQLLALYWLNVEMLGGLMYPVQLFGVSFEICQQGFALLALVPIWLYRGRQ